MWVTWARQLVCGTCACGHVQTRPFRQEAVCPVQTPPPPPPLRRFGPARSFTCKTHLNAPTPPARPSRLEQVRPSCTAPPHRRDRTDRTDGRLRLASLSTLREATERDRPPAPAATVVWRSDRPLGAALESTSQHLTTSTTHASPATSRRAIAATRSPSIPGSSASPFTARRHRRARATWSTAPYPLLQCQ